VQREAVGTLESCNNTPTHQHNIEQESNRDSEQESMRAREQESKGRLWSLPAKEQSDGRLSSLARQARATQQHSNTATQQHSNTATQQHSNAATQQHSNTATGQEESKRAREQGACDLSRLLSVATIERKRAKEQQRKARIECADTRDTYQ